MGGSMNPIRWGVLGAAAIAIDRFLPAMAGSRAVTLAGIASRSADKARTVALTTLRIIEGLIASANSGHWEAIPV